MRPTPNLPARIGGGVNLAEWCRFGGGGVDAASDVIKLGGDSEEEEVEVVCRPEINN